MYLLSFSTGNNPVVPTYVLVHGFPTSSFDFARLVDELALSGDVVAFDHVGFGFSDKPVSGFTYSIFEHADVASRLLLDLGLRHIVLVAHDMGDTITTEVSCFNIDALC